jgi:hypothetical protein
MEGVGLAVPALDGFKLLLLMGVGALFAFAGLYLLLRQRDANADAARIEIFGLKFQSSSAGLLVFLIGAGFFAAPLYVPERSTPAARQPSSEAAPTAQAGRVVAAPDPAPPAVGIGDIRLPPRADDQEIEPNDSIAEPNQIAIGSAVRGVASDDEVDWYVFAPDPRQAADFRVTFRTLAGSCATYHLLDGNENQLTYVQVCSSDVSKSLIQPIEFENYFVMVRGGRRTEYEVAISHE